MSTPQFVRTKREVFNRGVPPDEFLSELVAWARTAPDEIFAENESKTDIMGKAKAELGAPWAGLIHRKAGMLEVMRVLAGFESSWDWTEGVDISRLGSDTPENSEAGAWQVSYDSRLLHGSLRIFLDMKTLFTGIAFQRAMKFDHPVAMEYVARLMRWNTRHNGPLYKGDERAAIRRSLRGEEHSIYPWLSIESVNEFIRLLW